MAILIGLLLVVISGGLMFWNEGRSARTAAALAEGAGLVISRERGRGSFSSDDVGYSR